jgi:hypothetical protein
MDTQVAKKDTRKKAGDIGVYMNSLLSRKIHIPFKKVGNTILRNYYKIRLKEILKGSVLSRDLLNRIQQKY